MTIQEYIKANKRQVINNWRKEEHIREKYNFSILNYIYAHIEHVANDVFNCNHENIELQNYARELYKKI